jgi:hypothetical protein
MALSLDVRAGDKFFLKNVPVTVRSFAGYYAATVEMNGKSFDLSHEQALEIYPGVMISCGNPVSGKVERYKAAHRLLIDAPLSIRIPIAIRRTAQSLKASCAAKLSHCRNRNGSARALPRPSSALALASHRKVRAYSV